jgi:hypothetical protein
MGVSGDDVDVFRRNHWPCAPKHRGIRRDRTTEVDTMKATIKCIAPWIAAAAVGGAIVLAPVASADTGATRVAHDQAVAQAGPSPSPAPTPPVASGADPLVPFGTHVDTDQPYDPYIKNPGGGVDLPS